MLEAIIQAAIENTPGVSDLLGLAKSLGVEKRRLDRWVRGENTDQVKLFIILLEAAGVTSESILATGAHTDPTQMALELDTITNENRELREMCATLERRATTAEQALAIEVVGRTTAHGNIDHDRLRAILKRGAAAGSATADKISRLAQNDEKKDA